MPDFVKMFREMKKLLLRRRRIAKEDGFVSILNGTDGAKLGLNT
jgi:hypothetical protein